MGKGRRGAKHLVVGFDVELDFFACQGADSRMRLARKVRGCGEGGGGGYLMFMLGSCGRLVGLDTGWGSGGSVVSRPKGEEGVVDV